MDSNLFIYCAVGLKNFSLIREMQIFIFFEKHYYYPFIMFGGFLFFPSVYYITCLHPIAIIPCASIESGEEEGGDLFCLYAI